MGMLDRFRRDAAMKGRTVVLNPADPIFRAEVKRAIVAAAMEIDDEADFAQLRLAMQPWQLEALGYRATLGEIRYAADFYARPMRRLRWYVGKIDRATGEVKETDDPTARAAFARIRDPGGGTQSLITNYARLMFTTGEALELYTPEHTDEGDGKTVPESWEMLSTAELRVQADDSFLRFRVGNSSTGGEPLVEGSVVYRLWQRDPAFSDLADSPMRAVLQLCEELTILTLVVRARSVSRLAGNGLLFIPNDISLPPRPGAPVPDDDPGRDPILAELIRSLLAPIEDQGSASAAVPLMLRGPADSGEKIKHITVRDVTETFPENELRTQTIRRLGLGLDMPPSSLEGVDGMNHWNAWLAERDAWRHAEPVARQYADDTTAAYLQPYLRDEVNPDGEPFTDWDLYVVCFDASEILTNPDRGEDALNALKTAAIGYEAYRDAMGWDDDDAPSDEDLSTMVLFFGKGSLAAVGAEDPNGAPPASTPAGGGDSTPGPPSTPPNEPGNADAGQAAMLLGAADAMVFRHREIAGGRIRSKAAACEPCRDTIADVPNSRVAAALGYEACLDLGVGDAAKLVGSREAGFVTVALALGSVSEPTAAALARVVQEHAARTLFDEHPAPFPQASMLALLDRPR